MRETAESIGNACPGCAEFLTGLSHIRSTTPLLSLVPQPLSSTYDKKAAVETSIAFWKEKYHSARPAKL